MSDNIEVLDVKRRSDGKVLSVKIVTGPFQINYVRQGKKIVKTGVMRYDKNVASPSDLLIPSHLFTPAIKVVYGIFNS